VKLAAFFGRQSSSKTLLARISTIPQSHNLKHSHHNPVSGNQEVLQDDHQSSIIDHQSSIINHHPLQNSVPAKLLLQSMLFSFTKDLSSFNPVNAKAEAAIQSPLL
jgi:hypothetical protein